MFPTSDELARLLNNLSESFAVEVKSWIDPKQPEGKAKIVRACIALRNNNGGVLIIGFDDKTMRPAEATSPIDLRAVFGQDDIQGLITKYASESFEVLVQFVPFDGKDYPVICVPSGAKAPVAAKAEIKDQENKKLLVSQHCVYVRTLNANNTVSTAAVPWQDWPRLMDHFLDNREADIGRFMRRHLDAAALAKLTTIIHGITVPSVVHQAEESRLLLDAGKQALQATLQRKGSDWPHVDAFEMAAVISGEIKDTIAANRDFLNLLASSNRHLTGWPFFVVLTNPRKPEWRPRQVNDAWEQVVIQSPKDSSFPGADFWRVQPDGKFYAIRALDEDFRHPAGPNKVFSITTPIWRVGDVLAEAIAISRAMVVDPEKATLAVALRWTGLSGRTLVAWGTDRYWSADGNSQSEEDEAISKINIPLDMPDSALAQHVNQALLPVYHKFDGFEVGQRVVEEEIDKMLKKR